ncbi:hypothetical protein V6N13_098520 [Hibiscus sabdariffa]
MLISVSDDKLFVQSHSKFDPFKSYLAVNYLDRFLSSQAMLGDGGFVFDAKTIERMEYAILGALKWRMRSITPFSFIPFFTSFFKLKDPLLRQALNSGAVEIIFKAQTNVKFLEFKPSIIAASALLSASNELFPSQFPCFHKEISSCLYVHKENMLKCYNWMEEMGKGSDGSMFDMVSSSMQHGSQCAGPAVFMFRNVGIAKQKSSTFEAAANLSQPVQTAGSHMEIGIRKKILKAIM